MAGSGRRPLRPLISSNEPRRMGGDDMDEGVPDSAAEPHPTRLALDHPRRDEILRAHAEACSQGASRYVDPATHLFVFTASYLGARGACCRSDCRHCPYIR